MLRPIASKLLFGAISSLQSFQPNHTLPLTSVHHTLGTIVTASKDGTVQLHSLAEDHRCVATLDNHRSAVTGLDFSKRTLAIASTDGTISLCTPQHQ